MPDHYWLVTCGAALVSFLILAGALSYRRKKRLIDNLPTSRVEGVFIGLVELKGTAESEVPLTSFLAEKRCVYYRWKVEEEWKRTEQVQSRDKDGKITTRTRTTRGWKTVAEHEQQTYFYLRDESGAIRIHPQGAKIEALKVFSQNCRKLEPLYFDKGPAHGIANSTGLRRFTEYAIPLHQSLYLVGKARERDDIVAPEIVCDPESPMFLISTRSAEQISRGYGCAYWILSLLGFIAIPVAHYFLWREHPDAERLEHMIRHGWPWYAAYLLIWLLGWLVMTYNSLIDLRQRLRRAWSNTDVELKRRATLIPRIVNVLQGLKDHEGWVLKTVTQLRTQTQATEPGTSGPDPSGCLGVVRSVVENYPELKSNEGFVRLQRELARTEERIALARAYFNEACTFYNTRIASFPDVIIARLAACHPHPLIEAANFERATLAINLQD